MINVKSLKFDADQKLLDFVEKKVGKVEKFFDNLGDIDVTLSLSPEPENKVARLQTRFPGEDLVIERQAKTFEEAVTEAADLMKEKIVRAKERRFEKYKSLNLAGGPTGAAFFLYLCNRGRKILHRDGPAGPEYHRGGESRFLQAGVSPDGG